MVSAQTAMHIYTKDGKLHTFHISDIDSIVFVSEKDAGTQDNPYTVGQLLKACEDLGADDYLQDGAEVYTRGIITNIKELSARYGNATYYIADQPEGEPQFYVFRGFLLDKAKVTIGDELHVGDTVVVCGRVKNYQGQTLEYDMGNYLVEHRPAEPTDDLANALSRLEFPMSSYNESSLVLVHTATLNDVSGTSGINYSTEWDTSLNAQRWSCYQLYASLLQKNVTRYQGGYPNDTFLPSGYQFTSDPYWSTGYDHGHICPSADRLSSEECNMQTFFLTNMQPQAHGFNAGIWERMETQVRNWASRYDTLYICKGGTIDQQEHIMQYLGTGKNTIPVPRYFFMALLGKNYSGYTAIGLWVDHDETISTNSPIGNYAVNIRELERLTGLDFFHNLPDAEEERVETLPLSNLKPVWGLQ